MDELQEIIQDFLVETEELIEGVDQDLLELEKTPDDYELLNKVFRSVHTIKGAAGFLGFTQLVSLVHNTETVLNKLRLGELKLISPINDAILESVDLVKTILARIKNEEQGDVDLTDILSKLESFVSEGGPETVESTQPIAPAVTEEPSFEELLALAKSTPAPPSQEPPPAFEPTVASPIVESSVEYVESVAAPEIPPVEAKPPMEAPAPPASAKSAQTTSAQPPSKELPAQTIRVETNKLDNVMDLVGELVLGRNRLTNLLSKFEAQKNGGGELKATLSEVTNFINLVTSDLQSAVMKTRMQPIKKVFGRFPRVVRDLARDVNKNIVLVLRGEETELDKSVIEQINDPLVHIIRNSIDHGIESKERRLEIGKPDKGTLKMSAYYEGNNIIIEIEDDGKGIDPEKIGPSAVKKGVITQEELEKMGEKEIVNLVFAPGFSTAEKLSDISGRGVGMDVVKTNITKLNGMIDLVSKVNVGCTLSIKLPLTVAIMNALIVTTDEETFAIPLSSVVEINRINVNQIQSIDQKEVVKLRDIVLPLIRLKDLFKLDGESNLTDMLYVVVIGIAEKRVGIVVERLKGQEEVVIKSMGEYLSDVTGIAGATVSGDGKVMLILDIAALFEKI